MRNSAILWYDINVAVKRSYKIQMITINNIRINEVIISDHFKRKHSKSMNDQLILQLVQYLNRRLELPVDVKNGFSYFATRVEHLDKVYKFVWLLEDKAIYIGIINAHRLKSRSN